MAWRPACHALYKEKHEKNSSWRNSMRVYRIQRWQQHLALSAAWRVNETGSIEKETKRKENMPALSPNC